MNQSPARLRYDAARANPRQPLLRESPFESSWSSTYTVTLGPGAVKFLDFAQFFGADVEGVISEIQAASSTVEIEYRSHFEGLRHPDSSICGVEFIPGELEPLMNGVNWADKLRVHHALGRRMIDFKMPSWVYVDFHRLLDLGKHFAIAECAEAWVPANGALAKSYRTSPEHVLVTSSLIDHRGQVLVFRKTSFVQGRLEAMKLQEAQRREEAARKVERRREEEEVAHTKELAERLLRSRFTTFVYIMEDTRKGAFKIGHSRTPGKRERTLQSEVPEIVLRFAVPAEEHHERTLHAKFNHRRIRAEWFELSAREIIEVITFLRVEGDAERAEADFHWVGAVFLRGSFPTPRRDGVG